MNYCKDKSKTPSIKNLPEYERPRERILSQGVFSLSDAELLAVLLGSGSNDCSAIELGRKILAKEQDLRDFASYSPEEFMKIQGIGPAKACSLIAAIEFGRRIATIQAPARPKIRSPQEAADIFMEELRYLQHETFRVALLNIKQELITKCTISIGTLNSASACPRDVFREAIRKGAASVILYHNHPSGDPSPSEADISVTRQICDAGKIRGLAVSDHLVIGDGAYISFREKGLIS